MERGDPGAGERGRWPHTLTETDVETLEAGTLLRYWSDDPWFDNDGPNRPQLGDIVLFTGRVNRDFPRVGPHLEVCALDGATYPGGGWVYRLFQLIARPPATFSTNPSPASRLPSNRKGGGRRYVLVPREPDRERFDKLAHLWGYSDEETADTLGAILDVFDDAAITSSSAKPPEPWEHITRKAAERMVANAFYGCGAAIRREEDPPIPGEPFTSLEGAKRIALDLILSLPAAARTEATPPQ